MNKIYDFDNCHPSFWGLTPFFVQSRITERFHQSDSRAIVKAYIEQILDISFFVQLPQHATLETYFLDRLYIYQNSEIILAEVSCQYRNIELFGNPVFMRLISIVNKVGSLQRNDNMDKVFGLDNWNSYCSVKQSHHDLVYISKFDWPSDSEIKSLLISYPMLMKYFKFLPKYHFLTHLMTSHQTYFKAFFTLVQWQWPLNDLLDLWSLSKTPLDERYSLHEFFPNDIQLFLNQQSFNCRKFSGVQKGKDQIQISPTNISRLTAEEDLNESFSTNSHKRCFSGEEDFFEEKQEESSKKKKLSF